jgi:hypothetical protein
MSFSIATVHTGNKLFHCEGFYRWFKHFATSIESRQLELSLQFDQALYLWKLNFYFLYVWHLNPIKAACLQNYAYLQESFGIFFFQNVKYCDTNQESNLHIASFLYLQSSLITKKKTKYADITHTALVMQKQIWL